MSDEPRRRWRALKLSVLDGTSHAVMLAVGETFFGAFAVELGHRDLALGVLASVPLICGALAQLLVTPLSRIGGQKRLTVIAAALQAIVHLGFVAIAWTGSRSLGLLLGAKIAFWVLGAVSGPAWSAWMARLISGPARERFFAWRSTVLHAALLSAFLAAGFWLESHGGENDYLPAFGVLFSIAFVARSVSAVALGFQWDPNVRAGLRGSVGRRVVLAVRSSRWSIPIYVTLLLFGAHVSAAFFTPYMLGVLDLAYDDYAKLVAWSILAKGVSFPIWHRIAKRGGMRTVLICGGIAIGTTPFVWAATNDYRMLVFVQIWAGLGWAGFEYASFQLLLTSARDTCRAEFMALAASLAGIGQVSGAVLGGWLLQSRFAYEEVFVLSGVLRLGALIVFTGLAWRTLARANIVGFLSRIVSVRASGGTVRTPLVSGTPVEVIDAETAMPSPEPMNSEVLLRTGEQKR